MRSTIPNQKRGSILVIVMVIVITVTLLVAALLRLGSFSQIETIKQLRNTQAHWLAEAGLERALSWIFASEDYRNGAFPDHLSNDSTEPLSDLGNYDTTIGKSNETAEVKWYTITSIGTVSNAAMHAASTVQYKIKTAPGGQQGLLSLGGDTVVRNSDIFGDIYQAPPGTVTFDGGGNGGEGTIDAEGGINGSVPSGLVEGDLPDPEPGPWVDPADYNDTVLNNPLEIASRTNTSDAIQGNYTGTFDLNTDPTVFVNGNIILDADVTGSGTIVVNGTVSFGSNGVDIDDDVTIIAAGDISVNKNNTTFGKNAQLITMTDFYLSNNQDYPNPGVSIIAIGNVNVEANMDGFEGIIYAGGKVTFNNGGQNLEGAVIAWGGIDLGANASITYNPNAFANPNPIDYGNDLVLLSGIWQKL